MKKFILYLILFNVFLYFNSCVNGKPTLNNYISTKEGRNKNGIWIENIRIDSIEFEKSTYKFGKKIGKSEIYFKNGGVLIGKYEANKRNGAWKYYIKNTLVKVEYYTEGYLSRIEFIENGKVVKQVITDPNF